jgi:NAD(P)H-nitrite reductase large subunit
MAERLVVIGNGISGITAAQRYRALRPDDEVVVVGDESAYLYARTALMWVYMKQLTLAGLEPYERWHWGAERLELVQDRAEAIDTGARRVRLAGGRELGYDRLLLATGGEAARYGWPGQELEGVCNLCTLRDLAQLEAVRPRLRRAVVVGGGLIGIELVEMMLHDRIPVTYLIREPWYWELALSREEGELVHGLLRAHGVELILEDEPTEIVGDGGRVRELVTRRGRRLPCELVGIAVGVRPRTALAAAAGIACRQGILVDPYLRTSAPGVFAAGDCAELEREGAPPLNQKLWYTGVRQGEAVGRTLAGRETRYDPGIPYASAQFLFHDYLTVGWTRNAPYPPSAAIVGEPAPEASSLEEHFERAAGRVESLRIAHRAGADGQVLGFSLLGSRWSAATLMRWIEERRSLGWVRAHLGQALFNEELRRSALAGAVRHG